MHKNVILSMTKKLKSTISRVLNKTSVGVMESNSFKNVVLNFCDGIYYRFWCIKCGGIN